MTEGKSLAFSAGPDPVWTSGNAEMLFRGLRNLAENAIRYSPPDRSVDIEVVLLATIRILDRGPGIRPAERQLVFRRFRRRDRQAKGHAGMGLAIVAKIVQLHDGAIEVADRDASRAEFRVQLAQASSAPS